MRVRLGNSWARIFVFVGAFFIALLALLIISPWGRDALARAVWQKYRMSDVSLALNSDDADLAMQIGAYYFGGKEYDLDHAEKAYRKALTIDFAIPWGRYELARILFMQGDFDSALREINSELAAHPDHFRSFYVRGLIYGYRGDLDKAESDFWHFLQWAPKEWAGYNDLIWVLLKEEKYGEVPHVIAKAFNEMPDAKQNPWLWNGLGVAFLNLNKDRDARDAFLKAQNFAVSLTVNDWRKAYPGNAPESASAGLAAFRAAIDENLAKSRVVDKSLK